MVSAAKLPMSIHVAVSGRSGRGRDEGREGGGGGGGGGVGHDDFDRGIGGSGIFGGG